MDILALTETWLAPGNANDLEINETTPNGYAFLHAPRCTRGGGVAVIYRKSLHLKQTLTKITHVSSHVIISHVNLEPPHVTCDFHITCESHVRTSFVMVPNSHVSDTVISHVRTSHVMVLNSHVSHFIISHVSYL